MFDQTSISHEANEAEAAVPHLLHKFLPMPCTYLCIFQLVFFFLKKPSQYLSRLLGPIIPELSPVPDSQWEQEGMMMEVSSQERMIRP
jgi:hypothetical protein